MLKKNLLLFLKLIFSLAAIFFIFKIIAWLPAEKLSKPLFNKVVYLQAQEKKIEEFFAHVRLTYLQVVKNKAQEKEYQILYRQQKNYQEIANALASENALLRKKISFQKNYNGQLIAAEIVGRSPDNWHDFVTIAKGTKDGVRSEMAAINEDGLVGYVAEVYPDSAKVMLLTNNEVKVSCRITRTQETGVLVGANNGPFQLNYISKDSSVAADDILLTSGYSFRYPRNLPVGKIKLVKDNLEGYQRRIVVEPFVDFSKLDIIFLIN